MRNLDDYPFEIRPMTADEGGGFLISYPDFSTCISDGETVEEAIVNGRDALVSVIAALEENGFPVPLPGSGGTASGRFIVRAPKTMHAQLAVRAKAEGVSLNTMALTLLAQGLGHPDRRTTSASRRRVAA